MTNEPQNDKNNKESQLSGWNAFDYSCVSIVHGHVDDADPRKSSKCKELVVVMETYVRRSYASTTFAARTQVKC
jgi:hypothetical protein